jgi:phage protein U
MNGLQNGPTVMMTLGQFQFGIATAAYQELNRATEWRWPAQERFMQGQALQYVGPGGDTITLPGVIYPEYRGGFGQLSAMRTVADKGEPLTMIDGSGTVKGRWVIERLEEKQETFAAQGMPRKQEFTLSLRKFDDQGAGTAASATGTGLASVVAAPSTVSGVASFVNSVTGTIGSAAGSISAALSSVSSFASQMGDAANSVLAPLRSSLGTANSLLGSMNDAKRLLGLKPTNISALASATKIMNASTSAVANLSQSGRSLSNAASQMQALGSVPQDAMKSVQAAVVSVNKLTVAATSAQSSAAAAVKKLTPPTT